MTWNGLLREIGDEAVGPFHMKASWVGVAVCRGGSDVPWKTIFQKNT